MTSLKGLLALFAVCGVTATSTAGFTVYDSISNTATVNLATAPRTYMGQAYQIANFGNYANVTGISAGLVNVTGTSVFTNVQLGVQFWGSASLAGSGATPAFSNPLGAPYLLSFGAANLPTGGAYLLTFNGALNVTLDPAKIYGISMNWQFNTGSGLTSSDNFSTAIVGGASQPAPAAGFNPSFYYRNASGLTNFNFLGSDARNIGANSGLLFSLDANLVPLPPTAFLGLGFVGVAVVSRFRRRA